MRGLGGYGLGQLAVFAVQIRYFLFAPLGGLLRRAVEFAGAHEVEAQGPQGLKRGVQPVPQAYEQNIVQALVVRDPEELGLGGRSAQRRVRFGHVQRRRQGRRHRGGALRTLAGERQIQGQPGGQSLQLGLLPQRLGSVAADALFELHEFLREGDVLRKTCLVQKLRRLRLRQRLEEAGLLGRVFIQQLHRVRELRVLRLHARQLRGVAAAQGRIRLLRKLGRLADLDAAQKQKLLQQRLPVRRHGQQPELFHLYYRHISRSLPFPR